MGSVLKAVRAQLVLDQKTESGYRTRKSDKQRVSETGADPAQNLTIAECGNSDQ